MIMEDGRGTTWLAQVAEKWHNELAGGCWMPTEDHFGEKNSPKDITHKMVGNSPLGKRNLVQ